MVKLMGDPKAVPLDPTTTPNMIPGIQQSDWESGDANALHFTRGIPKKPRD